MTSANSPTPYRDDLFGPHFATSLFVSEPVHNLVHRMVLEPDGATYRGVRAPDEADREFLASSDNWFRPTQLKTGPDGALWVADMYRAVIEHPEWIPADVQKKLDLRAGSEEGRIYRVYPGRPEAAADPPARSARHRGPGRRPRQPQRLAARHGPAAAHAQERPLGHRAAAQTGSARRDGRKLGFRRSGRSSLLNGLDEATAVSALADPHPQVRRNAVKASEGMLKDSPRLADAVLALADDPDPRVRLQLALALGNWNDPRAGKALAQMVRRDPDDPWIRAGC